MEAIAYFKALADETRLRLLNLTLFQEFNVNELIGILQMGQSRVSRHLKILTDCGLLQSRRDGLWMFYKASGSDQGQRFIESIRFLLDDTPVYARDLSRAEAFLRRGRMEQQRFFDTLASDWDDVKREILGAFDLESEIIKHLPSCATAADLGCGTGSLLPLLLNKAQQVIGVDSAPQMLAQARDRLMEQASEVSLRIGELEHLPLRDNEVEAAVINLVLHHLAVPIAGIREAGRVLKRGRPLILAEFNKHFREDLRSRFGDRWLGFSQQEIKQWLIEAGFQQIEKTTYPLQQGICVELYKGVFYGTTKT